MRVTEHLQPQGVFHFFEEICAIPHGSFHMEQISDYLVDFAKKRGLTYRQDEAKNVIIWKDGTQGYENSAPVILQGHLDMVAVKNDDCTKDLQTEGLDLALDGDLLLAKGTSLGGDDGIAVAYALAILDDDSMEHPPIEAIFTTDEEVGLLGATAIDVSDLKGRLFLNMDSEDEGIFTVSCAGGVRVNCILPYTTETAGGERTALKLRLDQFKGGHSGAEIHKGRANAIMMLGRVLLALQAVDGVRLLSLHGGEADNAIAVFAEAEVSVLAERLEEAKSALQTAFAKIAEEYRTVDPDIRLTMTTADGKDAPCAQAQGKAAMFTREATDRVIRLLALAPHGVQRMNPEIEGFVQTSLNPGILETLEDGVRLSFSVRSSSATEKEYLVDRLRTLTELLGGHIVCVGDYPGWEYRKDSRLRDVMVDVYRKQYGSEPVVEGIHAGLECGIFAEKLPGLDAVSFGPQMQNIHTTRERLSISSTQRTWELLCATLKALK